MNYRSRLRKRKTSRGPIKIRGGKSLPIILAKHICFCAECLGQLKDLTNGLGCAEDETHRGIITKNEADDIRQEQQKDMAKVSEVYAIEDGKLIVSGEPLEGMTK